MVVEDQGVVLAPVFPKIARHRFQNRFTGSEIAQNDVVWAGKLEHSLLVFVLRTGGQGAVSFGPLLTLVGETGITPDLLSVVVPVAMKPICSSSHKANSSRRKNRRRAGG